MQTEYLFFIIKRLEDVGNLAGVTITEAKSPDKIRFQHIDEKTI